VPRSKTKEKLAPYVAKRDFDRTPEPAGSTAPEREGHRFVVQRHRASRLHYDFRLELDGVLVSWAVPKGPTLDPKVRRLAVHVEDHPVEYIDFEGVIPAAQYGGGDVIVWDRGTWTPAKDEQPSRALRKGELHFDLDGEKLHGRFVLVRTDEKQWILKHKADDDAVPGWDPEEHPRSVRSGRTNDEVAAAPHARWRSGHDAATAEEALVPTWKGASTDDIAALGALPAAGGTWTFAHHRVQVTNLDKVLFPARDDEDPVTKRELLAYTAVMAPHLLPYLHDRPVNLHRFPNGAHHKGFWDKRHPETAPSWLRRWRYADHEEGRNEWYSVLDDPAALVWMANHGALELHPWTSTAEHPHQPTWALVDIDPGASTTWEDVLTLARLYRTALGHLGVDGCPKVTGQTGVQIWIPVRDGYSFDDTRQWVEDVSRAVGATVPDLVSWAWRVDEREGRARLDYTQNAINKTLVVPWSTRPAPGAPVSVPITWDELDDPLLRPDAWTIRTALDRVAEAGDPLSRLVGVQQELPALG
jgi:bifunctional non-homologous end joining protein LigD